MIRKVGTWVEYELKLKVIKRRSLRVNNSSNYIKKFLQKIVIGYYDSRKRRALCCYPGHVSSEQAEIAGYD